MASSRTTRHGATADRRTSANGGRRRSSSSVTPSKRTSARKPRSRVSRSVLALSVVAAVGFAIWGFYPVARVQYREGRENARLEAELKSLKARNARLAKAVARLRTPEGVEDVARKDLGYVKQGESAGVVLDSSAEQTKPAASAAPEIDTEKPVSAPRGPWTPVLDLVFGYDE